MTGFAEPTVGYASIEVAFTPKGTLEGVIHRRADGTPVEVRVVIMEISPEAQEKAAELRVGDVLVSSNGDPVTSAFEFAFAGPFPGRLPGGGARWQAPADRRIQGRQDRFRAERPGPVESPSTS